MTISISILAATLLIVAARFATRDEGGVRPGIVWLAALLPALGLALAAFLGRSAERERIDVQFAGYRLPMTMVRPCGPLGKNIAAGKGVWIGGGRRWPDDRSPDLISLPGYRGHLAEICRDPSDALMVRQVRPGESWFQLPSQFWDLQPSNEADTQRLVLRGTADDIERGCISYGGKTLHTEDVVAFVKQQRRTAVRASSAQGRAALLKRFSGWPEDAGAACVDISSGAPQRCAAGLTGTTAPLFAWPTRRDVPGDWDFAVPEGATLHACGGGHAIGPDQTTRITVPQLTTAARWSAWKNAAAHLTLRMVTRRTVGGVADQSVAIPTDASDPLPLRLGTRYDLGFVRLGPDLIVILEDPSVQLRMPDLYGGAPVEVTEGEFELTFGPPPGEELLVVDLSSPADHLSPKTVFEQVQARVSIPENGDEFSVIAQGRPAQKRHFNEVFTLDVSRDPSVARPMLLVRRVTAPVMTYVLPLFAALLLILGTLLDRTRTPLLSPRWLFAPLLLALLDLRFAMATRWLLNEYSSSEALRNWIVNGAYLLIAPPLMLLAAALLRSRGPSIARSKSSTKDLYTLPDSPAQAPPPPARSMNLNAVVTRTRATGAALVARLREREVLPLAQWMVIAFASTLVWVALAAGERPDAIASATKLLPTLLVAALAAALAWVVFQWVSRWTERAAGGQDPFGFGKPVRGSKLDRILRPLFVRALVVGVAFLIVRALTYFTGSQEQLPGNIRVDVFALPLSVALLAAFTRPGEAGRAAWARFLALGALFVVLFGVAGGMMNDFGLLWIGGMAFVLALPAAMGERAYAYGASLGLFVILFLSPLFAPSPFREAMRLLAGNRQEVGAGPAAVRFTDDLQVSRDRDYYRLIDANQAEAVTAIPSQLAREVVIERERVRYQSLDGAWRESFRSDTTPHSPWTGAGFLRGRAVVGDPTFMRAARSDYVFPTYLRAELGTFGLLTAIVLYVGLFLCGALGTVDRMRASPLALWATAMAAGTGLFMLGGTAGIFPFSGKWPLLLSFASQSDAALGLALLMLALVEKDS